MVKETCPECKGKGKILCDCTGGKGIKFTDKNCPECKGKGYIRCFACGGSGKLDDRHY